MEILGIGLQLIAGVIFGLDRVIPRSWFAKTSSVLARLLHLSSRWRPAILKVVILAIIIVPVVYIIAKAYINFVWHEELWYAQVSGVVIGALLFIACMITLVAIPFTASLRGVAWFVNWIARRSNRLKNLVGDDTRAVSLLSNGLMFLTFTVVFATAGIVGHFLGISFEHKPIFELEPLQYFFLAVGVISLYFVSISLVFLFTAGVLELMRVASRARKGALWPIVLLVYITGGALLLVNACQQH